MSPNYDNDSESETENETDIELADAPPETTDGRQIADDAMRNKRWVCLKNGGGKGEEPNWKYEGGTSQEWLMVTNPELRYELEDCC